MFEGLLGGSLVIEQERERRERKRIADLESDVQRLSRDVTALERQVRYRTASPPGSNVFFDNVVNHVDMRDVVRAVVDHLGMEVGKTPATESRVVLVKKAKTRGK